MALAAFTLVFYCCILLRRRSRHIQRFQSSIEPRLAAADAHFALPHAILGLSHSGKMTRKSAFRLARTYSTTSGLLSEKLRDRWETYCLLLPLRIGPIPISIDQSFNPSKNSEFVTCET